jgi:hypothetical protein
MAIPLAICLIKQASHSFALFMLLPFVGIVVARHERFSAQARPHSLSVTTSQTKGIAPLSVAATGAGGTVMVATRLTQVRAFCQAQWWGGDYLPSLGGRAELDEDFFGKE